MYFVDLKWHLDFVSDCREVMEKSFPDYYDYYEGICKTNMHKQGETMQVSVKDFFSVFLEN